MAFLTMDVDEINELREKAIQLEKENKIYEKFVTQLLQKLKEEVDKDGYCKLIVSEYEVDELLKAIP